MKPLIRTLLQEKSLAPDILINAESFLMCDLRI